MTVCFNRRACSRCHRIRLRWGKNMKNLPKHMAALRYESPGIAYKDTKKILGFVYRLYIRRPG